MSFDTKTVLVVSASGALGGTICRLLLNANYRVRGLVRAESRAKIDELVRLGVEPVTGDLREPATLRAACEGVGAVVACATAVASPNPADTIERIDMSGMLALVNEAELAAVSRFIFISFPEQSESYPLQSAKRAVEARLGESPMGVTVLRPTVFQDVWLSPPLGFDYVEGRVRLFGDGHAKLSWIATADVAAAAVSCLADSTLIGKTIELGGPEALSANEVVEIFESVAGRSFAREYVPEPFLRSQAAEAPDPKQQSFFALALKNARGHAVALDPLALTQQAKTTVRDYARAVLNKK